MDASLARQHPRGERDCRQHQPRRRWGDAKKNEIKPWQVETYCIGQPSAQYVSKMEDVLDVYQRPYDARYPVVCFDETRKELHGTPQGTRPACIAEGEREAHSARQDYAYTREGSASLLLWNEPLTGGCGVSVRQQHLGVDIAELLRRLSDEIYPTAQKIVLVCDNLKTHAAHFLYERFTPEEAHRLKQRFEWHYTPEHGSWLNIAECELSVLSRQCLRRRIPDLQTLQSEVAAWEEERNATHHTVEWHFTTKDARVKLKKLYPITKYQCSP